MGELGRTELSGISDVVGELNMSIRENVHLYTCAHCQMHKSPGREWRTWGLPSAVVSEGKVCYELTLHSVSTDLAPQIGWVTQSFARVDGSSNGGVGDDAHG